VASAGFGHSTSRRGRILALVVTSCFGLTAVEQPQSSAWVMGPSAACSGLVGARGLIGTSRVALNGRCNRVHCWSAWVCWRPHARPHHQPPCHHTIAIPHHAPHRRSFHHASPTPMTKHKWQPPPPTLPKEYRTRVSSYPMARNVKVRCRSRWKPVWLRGIGARVLRSQHASTTIRPICWLPASPAC
jgi:hypothetical protein